MNNTTTQLFIQAKPLFRYKRNAGQAQQGKKVDPTVTTITLTGIGSVKDLPFSIGRNEGAGNTCYNMA